MRFLAVRTNKNPNETWIVEHHGDINDSLGEILNLLTSSQVSKLEYAIVEDSDPESVRLSKTLRWKIIPSSWLLAGPTLDGYKGTDTLDVNSDVRTEAY